MSGLARGSNRRSTGLAWSVLLVIWSLIAVGPLIWLIYSSLKSSASFALNMWTPPLHPLFGHWLTTLTSTTLLPEPIGVYVLNSIVISVPATVAAVLVGALAAYGLIRFRPRGGGVFWLFILLLLPVPVFAVMVPVYSYMHALGFTNTRIGLALVYFAFNLSFAVMLMRGFLNNMPKELVEAAILDGCSEVQAFRRIILPLARGALVAGGLLVWIGIWGEFPLATVMLQSPSRMTIQPALASLAASGISGASSSISPELSALALTTLLPVVVYLVSQRWVFAAVAGSWGEM